MSYIKSLLFPGSFAYLLTNFLLVLIGLVFRGVFREWFGESFGDGISSSIVATGIVGWSLWLSVGFQEGFKERIRNFQRAGLVAVFPARAARIKSEYEERLRHASRLDAIGFGLSNLREDFKDRFVEMSRSMSVRILLLDPSFPSPASAFASQRDTEENHPKGKISTDVESFISLIQTTPGIDQTKFQIRMMTCLPSINYFRIDDEIFWGPYLVDLPSRNMPTFIIAKDGFLFENLSHHFEKLWNDSRFSRSV